MHNQIILYAIINHKYAIFNQSILEFIPTLLFNISNYGIMDVKVKINSPKLAVTVSERYRIPLAPEIETGLWVDRIGSGVNFKNTSQLSLRHLGLYAAVGAKEGSGKFYSPQTGEINIKENDVMLLFPDVGHYYYPDYSWDTTWVVWNGIEAEKLVAMKYFSPVNPIIKNGFSSINNAHNLLEPLLKEETPTAVLQRKVILLNMLLELHKCSNPGISNYAKTTRMAINFIDANIAKDITLEEIANHCNFSVPHFRRIFNAETGVSPKEFLISRKISKAKEYLSSRVPVKETSEMLGFTDESYFRKVFKKITGITPGKFQ